MTSSPEADAVPGAESKAPTPPADDGEGREEEEVEAAPPREEGADDDADAAAAGSGSAASGTSAGGRIGGRDEEMYDLRLSPMDYMDHRQNLKGMGWAVRPPPLEGGGRGGGVDGEGVADPARRRSPEESALHRDECAAIEDPRNRESALESPPRPRFGRSVRRIAAPGGPPDAGSGGRPPGGRHSHPRKSPYRSEVARVRHAQRQQQAETATAAAASAASGGGGGGGSSTGSGRSKSVSIKDTTAPPDTAHFSIQSARLKHAILDSIADFLTGAFADDEETGGSYFSQDLLDQLAASNPYLRGVWLQAKNLNDDHVRRLCDALIRNKVVTEVWLPSNRITDAGACHIAHMLKFNRHIKELFLGENDIGPRGAAALASALARGNTTLVALGLGDNRIGVEGAGALAAALRHNHTLHTLDVKNNGIPRRSSIRGLLGKMLEFNSSDPGDERLVFGLQEELVKLVSGLPPDAAAGVVSRAEDALKLAMLCRRRGDAVGAAEAEGAFIRICTTGEAPADPPTAEEEAGAGSSSATGGVGGGPTAAAGGIRGRMPKGKRRPVDPDGADGPVADASEAGVADADGGGGGGPTVDGAGDVGEDGRPRGSDAEATRGAAESPSEEGGFDGTKNAKASAGD
jgi:hypothetical protein